VLPLEQFGACVTVIVRPAKADVIEHVPEAAVKYPPPVGTVICGAVHPVGIVSVMLPPPAPLAPVNVQTKLVTLLVATF